MVLQWLKFSGSWMRYLFLNLLLSCISWEHITDLYTKCYKEKRSSVLETETGKNNTANKYLLPSEIIGNIANEKQCITFGLFIISRFFKTRNEIEKLL